METIHILLTGLEKKYKRMAVLAPVTMIGEVLLEVLIPFIMSRIIDIGIMNHDIQYVVKTGFIMIGAACLSLCCGMLSGRFAAVASQGFSRNIRKRLFDKVQDFSFSNIDKFSTASLITRLTTDVTNAQNTFMMAIRMCVRAPMMLISAVIMASYINARLATMFLVAVPILAFSLAFIASKAFPRFKVMLKKYDKLNSVVQENLTSIRVVKAFVRGEYENTKFDEAVDDVRRSQLKAEGIIILNIPIMMMVMYLCIIAMLWFGGNMIIGETMFSGELISFISYQTQILMSLMMLSMIFVMLVISRASIARIIEVLSEEITISNGSEKNIIGNGEIDFCDVSFSYSDSSENFILENINLHIDSGKTIGIIGGTGSSKSTLVQLIPRLYDTKHGVVKVCGKDVRDYDLEILRSCVAMVLQKNILFSGTIKENLLWGNENASDDDLFEAAKIANADNFINSFPLKYETILGQGGVNLSGGQKQRLCIARAILKKPKILILDDSTSAVDNATDKAISEALKNTLPNTTKLIIAQRISSIKDADSIIVMEDGHIADFGTHDQLLQSSKIYQEVYSSQEVKNVK